MATDLERLVVQIEGQTAKFEKALSRIEGRSTASAKKVEKTFDSMQQRMNGSFSAIGKAAGGAFAAVGIGLSAREVAQYADTWTRAQNSLRVAGLSGAELTSVMGQLYDAAQRQGVPIESLTQLYGRTARSAKELGASQADLVRFSEDVATALRVAGTSPEAASGALLQLSQALGSARIQAEEFNSLIDGASPILQTAANGIEEAGGSINKLQQLVKNGELSNVAFFKGFQAGAAGLREQGKAAEDTIAQAFTRVTNAVTRTVGEIDKTTGASKNFVENMKGVSAAIDAIPAIVNRASDKLGELQRALNAAGNSPIWQKIGQFLGGDYSAAGAAAYGITLGPQLGGNLTPSRSASGGIGSDPDRNMPRPTTIRAADYPVNGPATGKSAKAEVDEYAQLTEASRRRIADLQTEQAALGMTEAAAAAYRFEQEALQQAAQKDIALSPQQKAELQALAQEYGRVTAEIEKTRDAQQQLSEIKGITSGFFSDLRSGLKDGTDLANSFANAVGNLTEKLLDMLTNKLLMQLLNSLFSGGLSGGGSVGNFTPSGGIGRAATGGSIRGAGTGTSDSIPMMLSNGEYVVNAKQAGRYRAVLEAINSGRLRLPGFATGGSVGSPMAGNGGMGDVSIQVVNETGVAAEGRTETTRAAGGQQMVRLVLTAVKKDMGAGGFDQVQRSRFGNRPAPTRRG